ncbi:kinase-like protein [Lojkania enalia]|uniref:Kinase-like protein n=1 Tax=Lojkania enalia TaxID=147567 RepID=A0A9P4KGJ4_9PLEO|nr:kinase-like protein [Didymosphaeria enalia]
MGSLVGGECLAEPRTTQLVRGSGGFKDCLDSSLWQNWSGRGFHVDFGPDDIIPLEQGRYLGRGAVGEVIEACCQGTVLALKRKFCRKKVTELEKKEIGILKKLSHFHIVKMDFESVYSGVALDPPQSDRLSNLGLPVGLWRQGGRPEYSFLLSKIGCLTGAIEYLHQERIRHQDLKPSNILLSRQRVWLTDFGSSIDFSTQSTKVANYLASGRAADIFSLGCIFLEIMTLGLHGSLEPLKALRPIPNNCHSFESNLHPLPAWTDLLRPTVPFHRHLLYEITRMLEQDPQIRPTARDLHHRLSYIDQFERPSESVQLFDECCKPYTDHYHRGEVNQLNNHMRICEEYLEMRPKFERLDGRLHIPIGSKFAETTNLSSTLRTNLKLEEYIMVALLLHGLAPILIPLIDVLDYFSRYFAMMASYDS